MLGRPWRFDVAPLWHEGPRGAIVVDELVASLGLDAARALARRELRRHRRAALLDVRRMRHNGHSRASRAL